MKKWINLTLTVFLTFILVTCKDDRKLVTYPESYPVFEEARVDQPTITYGDSISMTVTVSDEVTPLSTLEVQVVVNKEVVTSESIRTAGHSSTVEREYVIPFVAKRPNNEPVKIYLSSINVDGYTTDTILANTIALRPEIKDLWLVPEKGATYKLDLVDPENYIFHANGLSFGNSVSYLLATKVDKFKRVDWTGMVFGDLGEGIQLVDSSAFIMNSDPSLVGISDFTFDAYNFTTEVGGKLLVPVTSLDIDADLSPEVLASENFRTGNVYFGTGQEVTFTGLGDLATSLPPDYFDVTGDSTAVFLGDSAIYKAKYYIAEDYLYVEPQPDVVYPDAMWICGTGFGKPAPPYEVTSSWNWNTPFDYAPCRRLSEGKYQVTIYGKNDDTDGNGFGSLDFKFFFQRNWGTPEQEIDASGYTVTDPFFGRTDEGNTGNINGGPTAFEGVFRITLDQNTKTIKIEKLN